jgi:hypothetical protein
MMQLLCTPRMCKNESNNISKSKWTGNYFEDRNNYALDSTEARLVPFYYLGSIRFKS